MSKATQSDNVLRQMEDYDFNGKITATVILDDSDEENGPTVESQSNESTKNDSNTKIDNIVAEIIGEMGKICQAAKRRCSSEIDHQKDKKSKQDDNGSKKNDELLNIATNQPSNSCNSPVFRTNQSLNTQITCPLQRNDNIGQTSILHNQDDINKKANECMQSLLNTVSTHLVLIMKSYLDYKTFTTNSLTDIMIVERARKRFLDTKKHFFYLSYSTVVNIMIPKENDGAFVKSFIENTIRTANYRHIYPNFTETHSLYCELIGWVQNNLQQLQSVRLRSPYIEHPMLLGLLSKSPNDNVTTNDTSNIIGQNQYCQKTNNCSDSTCILKSGTPGKETSINWTSNSLNYQSASQQIQNTNQNTLLQDYQSQRENMSSIVNFVSVPERDTVINQTSLALNNPINKQINTLNQNISEHNHQIPDNMSNLANSRNFGQAFEVFSSAYTNAQLNKSKQRGPRNIPKKSIPRKPQPTNKQPPAQSNTLPSFSDILQAPPSYPSTQLQQQHMTPQFSERQYTTSAHYNQFQQDVNGQVDVNRSLSRDSGFMSPTSSIDHTCSSPRQDQPDQSLSLITPMITHVTSLNPSVAFIKDGSCHLCGKHTKTKCLGCYKTYYCSNRCQVADWKYHVAICKL